MKGLWKKFDCLTSKCYTNLTGGDSNGGDWDKAYEILCEIIREGRRQNSNYAPELDLLDDETDYKYDVCGWIEDYLDYLDEEEQYEKLRKVCEELIELFQWKEESPTDLRYYIAFSLGVERKVEEALAFCEEWYKKESSNVVGAAALIYARTAARDFEGANQIVEQYISEDGSCSDENDIVYMAAEVLYKVSGNTKAEKRVSQAIQKYEEEIESYFFDEDENGLDFNFDDIDDEDLPFL